MRSKFDEQLQTLNEEMIKMGNLIETSIQNAIDAFLNQDVELAKNIMEQDADVDHEQKIIEHMCFNMMIQQQPVARDMRTITAAMKMVTDMERLGDHAADISEMTIMMSGSPYKVNTENIKHMAQEAILMLIKAVESYVEKDKEKANQVIARDDVVDELFAKVKTDLIGLIRNYPELGEQAADLLMINKYLERIGDHCTNIAEWVLFSLETKQVPEP